MSGLTIEIAGLEVFAHHGVHDFERRDGQVFRFDVLLSCSSAVAGTTDDLLAGFPVEQVRVRVHKPQAPLAHPFDDVTVAVERRKG